MHCYLTIALLSCAPTASWESDYGQAQQHAINQRKPLAVVIGSGTNGWTRFLRTDSHAVQVDRLLADHYVCVYLDIETAAGKTMAQAFKINARAGLVISDRSGDSQAFWHQGDMTSDEMARSLARYSDINVVVKHTEYLDVKADVKPTEKIAPVVLSSYYPAPATYAQARLKAISQKRPLAIVFGTGANGWTKILRTNSPDPQIEKLLAEQYVCVYIDADTADGKKTSQAFGISGNVGLVLSDRSGQAQAFWHDGDMTDGNMIHYLTKYADAQVVVAQTETAYTNSSNYFGRYQVGFPSASYSVGASRTTSSANC